MLVVYITFNMHVELICLPKYHYTGHFYGLCTTLADCMASIFTANVFACIVFNVNLGCIHYIMSNIYIHIKHICRNYTGLANVTRLSVSSI